MKPNEYQQHKFRKNRNSQSVFSVTKTKTKLEKDI